METPANLLTPTLFCEKIGDEFKGLENVEIFVRDKGAFGAPNDTLSACFADMGDYELHSVGSRKGHEDLSVRRRGLRRTVQVPRDPLQRRQQVGQGRLCASPGIRRKGHHVRCVTLLERYAAHS